MALYEKMKTAMDSRDAGALIDMLDDDFTFVRHQSGTSMNRKEMAQMLEDMSASTGWTVSAQRCLYENDDILVCHSVMTFPDGSKEAVLEVNMLKDGKIKRLETGATRLD